MDKREIRRALLYGANLWPLTFKIPDNEADIAIMELAWERLLGDLSEDLVMGAMDDWPGHFPPTPRELRMAALKVRAIAQGEKLPDADEAWNEFRRDYRLGYDPIFEFSHHCVTEAARALGCRDYGQSLTDDVATWRAQFRGFYTAAVERHLTSGDAVPPSVRALQHKIELEHAQPEIASADA